MVLRLVLIYFIMVIIDNMYNAEGNRQLYSAQGSPQVYTPNGSKHPYDTRTQLPQVYTAQGTPQNIEKFQDLRPAFLSQDARHRYWAERSARGFPVGASELENKVHEKQPWIANDPAFVPVEEYSKNPPTDPNSLMLGRMPYKFRPSTERENQALETPSKIPGERPRDTSNKGCFYTANGEIKCSM